METLTTKEAVAEKAWLEFCETEPVFKNATPWLVELARKAFTRGYRTALEDIGA